MIGRDWPGHKKKASNAVQFGAFCNHCIFTCLSGGSRKNDVVYIRMIYLFSSTSNTVSIFQLALSLEAVTANRSHRSLSG